MNAPCKDCEKRANGCHSRCEKYIAYTKEREKIRESRQNRRFDYSPNKIARVRKNEINKMRGRAK